MSLTKRMADWIETLGAHIAVTEESGYPYIAVSESVTVEGDRIKAELRDEDAARIEDIIRINPKAAAAPAGLGAIRAAYQFKGKAQVDGNVLSIDVDEIYSTKPGPEAGIRLDVLGEEGIKEFDESRWQDLAPKVQVS